jgi:hypothetical protein
MSANPNWARWIFASIAKTLTAVATTNSIPVLVEGIDDETDTFTDETDRVEIRISGPFTRKLSGEYQIFMDVNVILTSRFDGQQKNRHAILTNAGLFHEAMDQAILVKKYGTAVGDDSSYLGCLVPRSGKNDTIRVIHFGKVDSTDKVKQSVVDARYEMFLSTS